MGLLGCAILGVILVNGIFSFWQEYKAEESIAALKQLIPHKVKVFRDGVLVELPALNLVPGDLIFIEEGDYVPADCRLIEASGIRVNNATLTGESIPLSRTAEDYLEEDVLHCKNVLLAGTTVLAGHGKALVLATGMNTEFGKIADLTQSTKEQLSPLQLEIVRLSRVIALIALSVGIVFYFVGQTMGISFWVNIVFAIGIIVALVPEGLLPEVTLALATCSRRMAKRNALIRHLPSIETLGCASIICTDKTGTLTEGRMSLSQIYLSRNLLDAAEVAVTSLSQEALNEMYAVALNCENARETVKDGQRQLLGDPMEIALIDWSRSMRPSLTALARHDELPFDTDRKRLTTIHRLNENDTVLYSKGALESLLPLCSTVYMNDGITTFTEALGKQFLAAERKMAEQGLRVLALCRRVLPGSYDKNNLESDLTLIGLVALEDPPRAEVPEAIRRCAAAGIRVIMVTGDHPKTAEAIARKIGLIQKDVVPLVITGGELRKQTDTQLQLMLSRSTVIFARADADQKMRIVQTLKNLGHIVAVTGDGVNDAPALKAADIGIAMGRSGTDVAREAADLILADDNFASIVNAVEEGRAVFSNIRKFLTYVLSSNIAELVPCLAFVIFKIPLPLTIIQILSVDLGTDLMPALALGTESPDPSVMDRPPRSRDEGLFDRRLLMKAYLYLGAMVSAASMIGYFVMLNAGGWHYGQLLSSSNPTYQAATTACLMGIMSMQIVNSSMCRSERKSIFSIGLFSNKFLNVGIAVQIALMLLLTYTPVGHNIFGTAPLPWQFWLMMLPLMSAMLLIDESRKWIVRRGVLGSRSVATGQGPVPSALEGETAAYGKDGDGTVVESHEGSCLQTKH